MDLLKRSSTIVRSSSSSLVRKFLQYFKSISNWILIINTLDYRYCQQIAEMERRSKPPSVLPSLPPNLWQPPDTPSLIRSYLLHNLSDPTSQTLNPDIAQIDYLSSSTYIGELDGPGVAGSKKEGRGVYRYSSHDVYMGDWGRDRFNGLGLYVWANGELYQGVFVDGASLRGVMFYASGDRYEGEFQGGYRHGQGQMKYKSIANPQNPQQAFSTYNGEWKNNLKNGYGVYKCPQYEISGRWEDDQLNGEATIRTLNPLNNFSFSYHGLVSGTQFVNGKGKFQYSGSEIYDGEVYKGKYNGQGRYSGLAGQNGSYMYQGQFKEGIIEGTGQLKAIPHQNIQGSPEQIVLYEGSISNGKMHGFGKVVYRSGDSFEGNFQQGLRQGPGRYRFRNGDTYQGQFNKDMMEGSGSYTWTALNLNYKGKFVHNQIPERAIF